MVSNLDTVSMIFALSLFNNCLAISAKRLGDSTINVHINYGGFCIMSVWMHVYPLQSTCIGVDWNGT
jgi:hypothetical protein